MEEEKMTSYPQKEPQSQESASSGGVNQSMGIGEVLRQAWESLTKNLGFLARVCLIGLGIGLVLGVFALILTAVFGISSASLVSLFSKGGIVSPAFLASLTGSLLVILLILCVVGLVIITWINGAYAYAVYNVLSGNQVAAWDCFKAAWKKMLTFIGLSILGGLMVGVGFMLLVLPGLIALIFLFFAFYLVVAENLGPTQAISRSFSLAAKKWLEIFLILLIVGLVLAILSFLPFVNFIIGNLAAIFLFLCAGILYQSLR